jgi:hypothetical protein
MSDSLTFPQHGDARDAAFFASYGGAAVPVSGIVDGFDITSPDFTNLTVDVTRGKAVILSESKTSVSERIDPDKTLDDAAHVVQFTGTADITISNSTVNELFVDPRLNEVNDPRIVVNPTTTTEKLKIGEVDTTNNTVSKQWNLIRADGTLSYPDSDAANTALQSLPTGVTVIDRSNEIRVTDGGLEAKSATINGGLEAESATIGGSLDVNAVRIDGTTVSDKLVDTRNSINQLFVDNARQDFELGLNIIDMDDGQFEIYANDNRIVDSSNVTLNLGSPLNGKGTVSLASSATSGFTEHIIEDYGFRPNSVVVTDDVDTNPQNGTIKYEIEDENGNIVTIPRSQLNQSIDVSGTIETYAISTRAVLERNSTTDTAPVLDAYSVYVSGQQPDDYLDARVTGVSEV